MNLVRFKGTVSLDDRFQVLNVMPWRRFGCVHHKGKE